MKSRHITKILDRTAFAKLSKHDLAIINAHANHCAGCRQAFEAARVSSVLLKTSSAENAPVPSPFFQAKVLNALREKQNIVKSINAFGRWWQASAVSVLFMLVTLGVLVGLTIFAPSHLEDTQAGKSNFNLYSTDRVIFNQKPPREMTNEQVLQVIYNPKNDFDKR
jgi:predicted anti-sigma-YlaC factor YlaD